LIGNRFVTRGVANEYIMSHDSLPFGSGPKLLELSFRADKGPSIIRSELNACRVELPASLSGQKQAKPWPTLSNAFSSRLFLLNPSFARCCRRRFAYVHGLGPSN
jgi:hypothetical protein